MIKTAIFVEGQTELIFVREFLLKMSDYQNISIDCFTLFNDVDLNRTEYAFPNEHAERYFQILNVGNDTKVLTSMLKREKFMRNAGFHKIIGLRDMYGKQYREAVGNHTIQSEINQKFISGAQNQLTKPNMYFIYSVMEIEAWLLGLQKAFQKMDERLTPKYIQEKLNYNILEIDPENYFFHPANNVSDLFILAGKGEYDKSKSDVNAIVSYIDKEDYTELKNSNKCNSFKNFCLTIDM